jgi:hypothetical protein
MEIVLHNDGFYDITLKLWNKMLMIFLSDNKQLTDVCLVKVFCLKKMMSVQWMFLVLFSNVFDSLIQFL